MEEQKPDSLKRISTFNCTFSVEGEEHFPILYFAVLDGMIKRDPYLCACTYNIMCHVQNVLVNVTFFKIRKTRKVYIFICNQLYAKPLSN